MGEGESEASFPLPEIPALTILFPNPPNILIALACSPSPYENPQGVSG